MEVDLHTVSYVFLDILYDEIWQRHEDGILILGNDASQLFLAFAYELLLIKIWAGHIFHLGAEFTCQLEFLQANNSSLSISGILYWQLLQTMAR